MICLHPRLGEWVIQVMLRSLWGEQTPFLSEVSNLRNLHFWILVHPDVHVLSVCTHHRAKIHVPVTLVDTEREVLSSSSLLMKEKKPEFSPRYKSQLPYVRKCLPFRERFSEGSTETGLY